MKKVSLRAAVVLLVLGMLFLTSITVYGSSTVEQVGNGQIDWEKGYIDVTGFGAPPEIGGVNAPLLAKRAAQLDAYRNAVEVINGVRVHGRTIVMNYTVANDVIVSRVTGFVKGAQFNEPVFDEQGRCQIVMRLPLGGPNGLGAMLYDTIKQDENKNTALIDKENFSNESKGYTGIVIDARGLGICPALDPRIYDPKGHLLYGVKFVDTTRGEFTTTVAYTCDIDAIKDMERVGKNPLWLKAASMMKDSDGAASDMVLSKEVAETFECTGMQEGLFAKAAIVVVIN